MRDKSVSNCLALPHCCLLSGYSRKVAGKFSRNSGKQQAIFFGGGGKSGLGPTASEQRQCVHLSNAVRCVFRGLAVEPRLFHPSADSNFCICDDMFPHFSNFSARTSKFSHLLTKKCRVLLSPRPRIGDLPLDV